jgi:hypothetical protein
MLGVVESKIEDLTKVCAEFKTVVLEQKSKLDTLCSENGRKNLVVFGVEEADDGETPSALKRILIEMFKSELGMAMPSSSLENAHRLGRKSVRGARPVLAEFTSKGIANEVLIRHRDLGGSKVYIRRDRTRLEREERKQLIGFMLEARLAGECAYLRNGHLSINGISYTLQTLINQFNQ